MRNDTSKPLGILVVLGGLLLLAGLSQLQHSRTSLVQEDFQALRGMYLGQAIQGKSRMLVIQTQAGIEKVYLDSSIVFRDGPAPGEMVEVMANVQDDTFKLVRAEDVKLLAYTVTPQGESVEMVKAAPEAPWIVERGKAWNGGYEYKTSLPDGTYQTLRGVKVGTEWIAYDQ